MTIPVVLHHIRLWPVLFLACEGFACTQAPPPRERGTAVRGYADSSGGGGSIALAYDAAGQLKLQWLPPSGAGAAIPVPFSVGGDIHQVAPGRFLVSGFEPASGSAPQSGWLLDVQLGGGSPGVTIASAQPCPALDLIDMEFSAVDGMIYAVDWHSRRLLASPWTGALLPQEAWITVASDVALPMLKGVVRLDPTASGAGVRVVNKMFADGADAIAAAVTFAGTGFLVVPELASPPPPQWAFSDWLSSANGPAIQVHGLQGASGAFELQDLAGIPIVSATMPSSGSKDLVIAPGGVIPGAPYRIVGGSGAPSVWQTINSVWGVRTAGDLVLRRGVVDGLHVGNPAFSVDVRSLWSGTAQPAAPIEIYLAIGFQVPGISNVTTNATTGVATISSIAQLVGPMSSTIEADKQGAAVVELPVPDDAGIAGIEALFQWIAWDGTAWAFSEVHGSLIFPSPSAFASAMATSSPGTPTPSANTETKARSWLRKASLPQPTGSRRNALVQAIQATKQ